MKAVFLLPLFLLACSGFIAKNNDRELDWWETTIFYQIYPRSFADSDGDGIGDLNGITSKLEYIKDLGVGAIWLSPMFQSPMYDFGYDISDFYAVHDEYGTMEDFDALIARADELVVTKIYKRVQTSFMLTGIKVVLDLVPNHTSNESVWFQEALNGNEKYYNYFVWEDGIIDEDGNRRPPNNWLSHFRGSAWEYREEIGKYYLHQFVVGQPDLNYRNPEVVEEMNNIIRFWLGKGVAGFRVDAVNCLFEVDKELFGGVYPDEPPSGRIDVDPGSHDSLSHIYTKDQNETYYMVYQWRDVFDEFKSDGFTRVMMTEVYASIQDVVRYFGEGHIEGAQMPFNFDLITDVDASSSAADIKRAVDKFLTYKPVDKDANWVVGNHDNSRMATRYGSALVDGINMLVLLLPGVAVTYMGEEIGLVDGYVSWEDTVDPAGCNTNDPINYVQSSRDPERTPFQWNAEKNAGFSTADKTWLPVADGYETLNVEVQMAVERSHLKVYQFLAKLRQEKAFRYGRYESVAMNQDVFVFRRWYNNDTYIVVLNMRDNEHVVDLTYFENVSGEAAVLVRSIQSLKNDGDVFDVSALPVAGFEGLVLKLV
ncbi:maltase A1 isoform X1 [Manduca sexta]|uniref:maltase A1 isoform X1 n=1 Tax=Manduca sexta TaxID=7130 RepID=UPI0011845C77|nr:maltase A1 isoform X1 [Manduca sexta]